LTVRHADLMNTAKQEGLENQFFANYSNDPNKITPSMLYQTTPQHSPEHRREERRSIERGGGSGGRSWEYGDRSPRRERRDRSPDSHTRNDRRRLSWSGGRNGRNRNRWQHGGRFQQARPPRVVNDRPGEQRVEPPPEFKDKVDPREPVTYVDLDRPPEDNFEIDYEKALAAFASGGQQ